MVPHAVTALLVGLCVWAAASLTAEGRGMGHHEGGFEADWGRAAGRVHQMQQKFQSTKEEGGQESLGAGPVSELPCCYPPTWQGIMYRYQSSDDIEYLVTFYEDDPTQRFAADVVITQGNSSTPVKVTQIIQADAASKKLYVYTFDKAAKTCKRAEFYNVTYAEVTESCIPADAFFAGTLSMGMPKGGASLALRSWMWPPIPTGMPFLRLERLVTPDCAPAMRVLRNLDDANPMLVSDYYFNIQGSISDPSVFTLPDYCKQPGGNSVEPMSVGAGREVYLDFIGSGMLAYRAKK